MYYAIAKSAFKIFKFQGKFQFAAMIGLTKKLLKKYLEQEFLLLLSSECVKMVELYDCGVHSVSTRGHPVHLFGPVSRN